MPNFSTGNPTWSTIFFFHSRKLEFKLDFLHNQHNDQRLLTEKKTEKHIKENTMIFRSLEKNMTPVWHPIPGQIKCIGGGHP